MASQVEVRIAALNIALQNERKFVNIGQLVENAREIERYLLEDTGTPTRRGRVRKEEDGPAMTGQAEPSVS